MSYLHLSTFRRCVAAHRGEHKARDQTGKRGTLLTNNFALKPELIADLYHQRWQVKLFFNWIKQHLRIKAFVGTSETRCRYKS